MALVKALALLVFVIFTSIHNVTAIESKTESKPKVSAGDVINKPTSVSGGISSASTTNEAIQEKTLSDVDHLVVNNDTSATSQDTNETHYRTGIYSFREHFNLDTGAVRRTFYVVVGLTGVVLLYFTVKGIRMRKKRKTRRYGLLAEQELEPLDGDDEDEEDMTLFEANRQKKNRKPQR